MSKIAMECKTSAIEAVNFADTQGLLLTANRRLASYHQKRLNEWHIHQGHESWPAGSIAPLKSWLQDLWHDHCQAEAILLTDFQELQVWERIIRAHQPELLESKTSAQMAKTAYETLALWNFCLRDIVGDSNEQVAQFYLWGLAFEKECAENQWCNFAQIITELQTHIADIPLPEKIELDGFDDLAPAYKNILRLATPRVQLKEPAVLGMTVTKHTTAPPFQNQSCSKILLDDAVAEIRAMALWAKAELEKNPLAEIGCIVPNLAQIREQVESIFTRVFCETHLLPGHTDVQHFFNLSAGDHFTHYEIIRSARAVLTLVEGECALDVFGDILQSPYLCNNEYDASLGAKSHAALLKLGAETLPFTELYEPLSRYFDEYPQSTWLSRLRHFKSQIQNRSPRAPSAWANFYSDILKSMGWPGARTLASQDYQLCKRFFQALKEFSALDVIFSELNFNEARRLFNDLLSPIIFQPQAVKANIQILGTLESAGFHFDAAWIMGMNDEAWPPVTSPNPYLPYEFQKKNNMPRASASRELQYAKQVLKRLLSCAPQVIVSAPLREGDKILQESELIKAIPEISLELIPALSLAENMLGENTMEILIDAKAPALSQNEKIRGGSWIIKQQSICPFRAYASVRLQAESLPETGLGLSPSERGILLHRCLERIWNALENQENLIQKSTSELNALIHLTCSEVLGSFRNQQIKAEEKFLITEQKRLEKILFQWLQFEKTRAPFRVITTEGKFNVLLHELNLKLQVDRIDQLETGEYVIIDYKTGNCQISDWLSDRPQDPQLPLYCSFTTQEDQKYSGISFAEIKPGKLQFKGFINGDEESEKYLPGITATDSWEMHLTHWRSRIETLAQDFCHGEASVDPNDKNSCQYCDLQPLCRISSEPSESLL
jgi:ATP-dependent helicase/nuclease subunit B